MVPDSATLFSSLGTQDQRTPLQSALYRCQNLTGHGHMPPDLSQQGFLGNVQGEGSSVSRFVWFHADVPSGNGGGGAVEKRSRKRPRSEVRGSRQVDCMEVRLQGRRPVWDKGSLTAIPNRSQTMSFEYGKISHREQNRTVQMCRSQRGHTAKGGSGQHHETAVSNSGLMTPLRSWKRLKLVQRCWELSEKDRDKRKTHQNPQTISNTFNEIFCHHKCHYL